MPWVAVESLLVHRHKKVLGNECKFEGTEMIKYALKCSDGHPFESWFRDSAAFDTLVAAGQVSCTVCGSSSVEKTIMAPSVGTRVDVPSEQAPLSAPSTPAEAALAKLRDHLQKNSDYVGKEFVGEARKIHEGESDQRSIWGEASLQDAKALHDEGIPVAPLPFVARRDD